MLDENLTHQKCYYKVIEMHEAGEPIPQRYVEFLASSPQYSVMYAMNVTGKRFIEAEPYIATSAASTYKYSKFVTKQRFHPGEHLVLLSICYRNHYLDLFPCMKTELPSYDKPLTVCNRELIQYFFGAMVLK